MDSKEPQPVPEEIKQKVRASGQQRYGDKTVYSHQQQACYEAGGEFGYSLASSEISTLKQTIEEQKKEIEELQERIDYLRAPY